MVPSSDLLPDEPMPAPQRPMRRAPQDAQNNAATRGASSTACRRRNPPSLRAGRNPSDGPGQTGHGQAAPGSLPQAPVIGFHRRSSRSPPAQHLSYPLPAEPPRSIPPTLVRQAPGRPRRTFETPVSARTFARLPPMSAFSRPPADEQTTTRKSAVRRPRNIPHPRLPRYPATRAIPFPHFFPPASVPTHPRRPPSLPERPFRSDLHSGAFRRAPVFSPAPVKPRAAPALLPFPARIPTSPPRSALPLVPASDPPRFPRAFSCAFPALLPHSIPPFCASFVKKHHKVRAAAQNLCNAAHLRALRPGLRSNCPATSPAGHRSPT